ncbi:unnamed protein product [Peronospora farinosa]|uniref:Uncharacterized protein n=1 Tax=Peronospora farinosa TaxID=134698 RepID=A0AAV0TC59_9STRA|nr:unnamed protein product [Peronospora farinosa]
MASSDSDQKKSGATRGRKLTPHSRVKKNVVTETKKIATKRRASPRKNLRKTMSKDSDHEKPLENNLSSSTICVGVENEHEMKDNADEETSVQVEIAPAQDTQLRRNYLQRIYRQLQSTHPHQNDTLRRQVATNVEMQTCQKATTRSEYAALMDQEIHKLMQVELAQANASVYTHEGQSFDNLHNNNRQAHPPIVSSEIQSGYSPNQISHSRSFEYAQALAKAQSQETNRLSAYSTPRQSASGDNSFQSLMTNQTPGYGHGLQQQQQQQSTPNRVVGMQSLPQIGNQFYSITSKMPLPSQNFLLQSNVGTMSGQDVPRAQQQLNSFQMQSQYKHQSGSTRLHQRVSTFQEFSAQIQHLDKSVLIELLWKQRGALAQWQRQAKQLELQLSVQQNTGSSIENSDFHSPYNSPNVSGSKFVCPNVSAEAEMQRGRERNNARNVMSQYSYTQQSNESSPACSQAAGNGMDWGENAQVYWDKVRSLKTTYSDQLRVAKRALANNSAPPNTLYSAKAKSVMNNICLVIDILGEQPTNMQPRKFDVLTSIEHFIQVTVVPIVRKVRSSLTTSAPQTAVTSASFPAVATSVATYASENSPSQSGAQGLAGQRAESHNAGSGWSSNTISEQSSRESYTQSADVKSSPGRIIEDCTDMPTRMEELPPSVENSPTNDSRYTSSQYASVRPESNDAAVMQSDTSADQASEFEANMMPNEPFTPTSEFRLPTVSEMRPPSSQNGIIKDSKVLQSNVDVLNDFNDFSELDFDEDSSNFSKENNSSNISMKRGIEDV